MGTCLRSALIVGLAILGTSFRAAASCVPPVLFGSGDHYIYTPGVCPDGAPCPGDSSVTAGFVGSFWAIGFGDAHPGYGVDSGSWPALEGAFPQQTGWVRFDPNQPAYIYGGEDPRQDSCINTQCMALLLSDQGAGPSGPEGDFAVATAHAAPGDPFVFDVDLVLSRIPTPVLTSIARLPDGRVSITLRVDAPAGGMFLDSLCNQSILLGYRVYHTITPPGGHPATLRRENWTLVAGGDAPVPFGSSVTVVLDQGCGGWRRFLASSIVTEGGFETEHLSPPRTFTVGTLESIDYDCDGYTSFGVVPELFDCDDSDPHVYPGAPQICDHKNNDCLDPHWPSLEGTNESGPDGDADSWADTCDDCPLDPNPSQADRDLDGAGDACDLADGLILLRFAYRDEVVWQQETGFDAWNVYRGSLDVLRASGVYTQAPGSNALATRTCGIPSAHLADSEIPASGQTAFYLVSGRSAGVEGDLGNDSAGRPRPNMNPCP